MLVRQNQLTSVIVPLGSKPEPPVEEVGRNVERAVDDASGRAQLYTATVHEHHRTAVAHADLTRGLGRNLAHPAVIAIVDAGSVQDRGHRHQDAVATRAHRARRAEPHVPAVHPHAQIVATVAVVIPVSIVGLIAVVPVLIVRPIAAYPRAGPIVPGGT